MQAAIILFLFQQRNFFRKFYVIILDKYLESCQMKK